MRTVEKWAVMSFLFSGLLGCQSPGVRSEFLLDGNDADTGNREGVSYYLPKRLIKVTYTRAFPATTAAKRFNKALQAQGDADKAAGATKAAMVEAEARRAAADPASPAYQQLEREAAYQVVLHRIATAALAAADGELASATGDLERERTAGAGACGLVEKLEFAPTAPTADTKARFIASVPHSIWRRDQVTLQTTKDGLLTSSNATLTDQTSEVLVAFASSLVAGRSPLKMSTSRVMDAPPKSTACLPAAFELTVSPEDLMLVDHALAAAESPLRLSLQDGGSTETPMKSDAVSGGLFYRRDQTHLMRVYRSPIGCEAACSIPDGLVVEPPPVKPGEPACATPPPTFCPGALPAECETAQATKCAAAISAACAKTPTCALVASVPLLLPNYSPPERIAMNATTFATNVHGLTFEQGMLTQAQTDQPSELLAIVKLPTNIISGVLGSVTNLIQLRFNVGQQETALANQERALLCALHRLNAVQTDTDPELPATLCP